jgi:hypothetical protein
MIRKKFQTFHKGCLLYMYLENHFIGKNSNIKARKVKMLLLWLGFTLDAETVYNIVTKVENISHITIFKKEIKMIYL